MPQTQTHPELFTMQPTKCPDRLQVSRTRSCGGPHGFKTGGDPGVALTVEADNAEAIVLLTPAEARRLAVALLQAAE